MEDEAKLRQIPFSNKKMPLLLKSSNILSLQNLTQETILYAYLVPTKELQDTMTASQGGKL